MDDFFDKKVEEIKEKYKELGFSDGWRFLFCPKKRIIDNNRVLILGLNPGEGVAEGDDISESVEEGNVYLDNWNEDCGDEGKINDKLQRNLKDLFKKVSEKCGKKWEDIIKDSLTSNFISFRSQNIKSLKQKKECYEFAFKLWTDVIEKNDFKVIICMGNCENYSSYSNVKEILEKRYGDFETNTIPIKWWKNTIKYSEIPCENNKILLVGLPHFSYFSFIERPKSKKAVDEITDKIAEYIK